jgi:predicted dehydrogenase
MIGQCLRFDPSYEFLKEAMEDGRFGKVEAAFFQRVSSRPVWGYQNWFMDPSLSGGCLTDLHIHDVDMVRYLFGEPDAVSCRVNSPETLETVFSTFFCGNTPISAIGDWSHTGVPFSATYRVNFEKATVIKDGALSVYPKDGGEKYEVSLPPVSCYGEEIAYFCRVVEGWVQNEKNPPESAARTVSLIEHLRKSADESGKIIAFTKNR